MLLGNNRIGIVRMVLESLVRAVERVAASAEDRTEVPKSQPSLSSMANSVEPQGVAL
jgi:hypothetical protein